MARAQRVARHRQLSMQNRRLVVVVFAIALVAGCATDRAATRPPAPAPTTTRTPAADPTRGQFINTTSWALQVWVDPQPVNSSAPASVTLKPGEAIPWTLRQGEHRIVAHAHAVGQPGGPVVARFDRTIALDPARPEGWFLRFREADFR
jgi:hypothetical protein